MHVNLVWNSYDHCRNLNKLSKWFWQLTWKISELVMMKNLITLSFYFKTQTRTTKGTRKWLDLGKPMVSSWSCGLAGSWAKEKERKILLVVILWNEKWDENVDKYRYVLL